MQTNLQKAVKPARPHVHGRRSEDRIHVLLSATVLIGHEKVDVRVKDVSSRGAMICTEHALKHGEELNLSVGAFQVIATVAWTGAPYYGLCFHRPIALVDLLPDPLHGNLH